MDICKFEKRVKKYDIVTFDIFDTLLKRDVLQPVDVFELVQKIYKNRFQTDINFSSIRIEAEKKARENSKYGEVTLDEIYEYFDISDKKAIKQIEIETESKLLHQNHTIKMLFDKCIELGKIVYIISDMYLPKDLLNEILQREGYSGYKEIILSVEYRMTKRSGKLYSVFLKEKGIKAKDVIHIGDSLYADYIGAKRVGIAAIHVQRIVNNTLYMKIPCNYEGLEANALFSFINSRTLKIRKRSERLGYEVLGPILYGYCLWIHGRYEQIKSTVDDTVSLWFAARDMFLFKEAYKIIYNDETKPDYMYISRKSLRPVLTMTTGDVLESGNVFPRVECSLEQIVKRMGYTIADIDNTTNIDIKRIVNPRRLSCYPEIKIALSSPNILKKERELGSAGLQYLKEHGFENSKIVLADVGWHGTTQYILQRILSSVGSNRKVYGLYLGCMDSTNKKIGIENFDTYVFNENDNSDFAKGILLFESLILAPHGSTDYYKTDKKVILPVLGKPDNQTDFLISVQRGALEFVKEYKDSILSGNIDLNSKLCTNAFCHLATCPTKDELDAIGQMDYDDFEQGKMADPAPLIVYLFHPKKLYNDMKRCPWRIGFIYKLLKVRLPYGKMYSFMRKALFNKKT